MGGQIDGPWKSCCCGQDRHDVTFADSAPQNDACSSHSNTIVREGCAAVNDNVGGGHRPTAYYRKINLTCWLVVISVAVICWIVLSQLL